MTSRAASLRRTAPRLLLRAATHRALPRALAVSQLLLLLPLSPRVAAQPIVAGDREMLWIVQPDVPVGPDTARGVRLIHSRTGKGFPYAAPYPPRVGQVRRCAVLRGELWAFFGGGGPLYVFNPTAARVGLQLPGGHIPLALAGAEHDDAVLAVVPGRLVESLVEQRERFAELLRDEDEVPATSPADTQAADSQPASAPADTQPYTGHWLIRHQRGQWQPVEPLPEWFDAASDVRLAALDVSLMLVWRSAAAPAGPWLFALHRGGRWSPPEDVPGTSGALAVEPGWIDQAPALVAAFPADNDPRRSTLRLLRRRAVGWTAVDLHDDAGAPFAAARDQLGAALVNGEVVAAVSESAEVLRWTRWSADGGAPLAPLQPIPLLSAPPRTLDRRHTGEWASYVALFLLLAFVMWRRQESMTLPAMLPPGIVPAQLSRRFTAFVLDLLPPAILTSPLWWPPLADFYAAQQDFSREVSLLPHYGQALWWPLLWTRLAWAVWCLVWELARGNTPGKVVMRLGVLSLSGRRANRAQLIARNLIRIIELEPFLKVWPLMMLILITRNRQRLGDIWARTLVVQRVPIPEPSSPADDDAA